jgi:hypothetical protein
LQIVCKFEIGILNLKFENKRKQEIKRENKKIYLPSLGRILLLWPS